MSGGTKYLSLDEAKKQAQKNVQRTLAQVNVCKSDLKRAEEEYERATKIVAALVLVEQNIHELELPPAYDRT